MIDLNQPPPGVFVYRAETHFDELDAQWILHHSSQIQHMECARTTAFSFHSADGSECFTKGTRMVCKLSMRTGEPTRWTEKFRTRYGEWEKWGRMA